MHRNRQRFQFTRSICSVVDFFSLLARSLAVAFIWFFSPKPLLNERDLKSINAIIWVLVIDRIYLLLPFPAKNKLDGIIGSDARRELTTNCWSRSVSAVWVVHALRLPEWLAACPRLIYSRFAFSHFVPHWGEWTVNGGKCWCVYALHVRVSMVLCGRHSVYSFSRASTQRH